MGIQINIEYVNSKYVNTQCLYVVKTFFINSSSNMNSRCQYSMFVGGAKILH